MLHKVVTLIGAGSTGPLGESDRQMTTRYGIFSVKPAHRRRLCGLLGFMPSRSADAADLIPLASVCRFSADTEIQSDQAKEEN
jgi:hypothetical protein